MKAKNFWKFFVIFLTLIGGGGILPREADASEVVTTLVVREKAGVTTTNYPLTFGHVFRKGEVRGGVIAQVNGTTIPTQFDAKTTWNDGSIRFGIISVVLPRISANQDLQLELTEGASTFAAGALSKEQVLAINIENKIRIQNLRGSGYSGSLDASLMEVLQEVDPSELKYWLNGPICTEILVSKEINPSLTSDWELRIYPNSPFIRVSVSLRNDKITHMGNVSYDLSIHNGSESLAAYSKDDYLHVHNTRWRKIYWIGSEPTEVEIRYDLDYLISTGMIMNYDTSLSVPEDIISDQYSRWNQVNTDIDGNGFITKYFGTTGGRQEVGILPTWTARYLLSMDNRMRKIMLGNAEIAGQVPIHFTESDPLKKFNGKVISIDDRPSISFNPNPYSVPPAIGDLNNNGWSPDLAHQASFAYVPYMITGDFWFLQEMYYWAAYNLANTGYGRDGKVGEQPNLISGTDGSFGLLSGQMRAFAWGLRNISDAAALGVDSDQERAYFASKTQNNLIWLRIANSEGSHGLHAARTPGENSDTKNGFSKTIAPWQHDFVVIVLTDIIRKEIVNDDFEDLRNLLGEFTIGRFTNNEKFPRFEGAGYWWPLRDKEGNYYTDGDWSRFFSDVLIYEGRTVESIKEDFSNQNYPYSYAYIARGTLASLTNSSRGRSAFEFLNYNLNTSILNDDPTWAFIPRSVNAPKNLKIITD